MCLIKKTRIGHFNRVETISRGVRVASMAFYVNEKKKHHFVNLIGAQILLGIRFPVLGIWVP